MRKTLLSLVTIAALGIGGLVHAQDYGPAAKASSESHSANASSENYSSEGRLKVSWEKSGSFDAFSPSTQSSSTSAQGAIWVRYPSYTYLWNWTPRYGLLYWIDWKPGRVKYTDGSTAVAGPSFKAIEQYAVVSNWSNAYAYNNGYGYNNMYPYGYGYGYNPYWGGYNPYFYGGYPLLRY